jgi:Kdo2-lipid IVA lauroyltransferase/acyltransferase
MAGATERRPPATEASSTPSSPPAHIGTGRFRGSPVHPRQWPMLAGLGLLWALSKSLPYRAQLALAGRCGRIARKVAYKRRHVADVNLALCFPERSQDWRDDLVRRHFQSLCMTPFEMAIAWWGSERQHGRLLQLEGIEHVNAAHRQGRGVLLVTCHTTCHELCGCLLAGQLPQPPCAIYKPFKNPVLERAAHRGRQRYATLANRKHLRHVVRHLKAGGIAWYAPDQSEGRPGGVLVPFFGEPKLVHTAPARLARATGAAVMPLHNARLPGGKGYRVIVRPPLEGFPSGDDAADARRIIEIVEAQVELAPEQYSWYHRRFRKRLGLTNPYRH